MSPCVRLAVFLIVPTVFTVAVSASSGALTKGPNSTVSANKPPAKRPATVSTVVLTIPSRAFLKKDLVIRASAGTRAELIVDSPDTLVTFPDGSQMLAVPDAAYLFDYRKSLATTGAEKVTFLVDAVDHFTFLDKGYSQIAGGISFYAKKDLPNLVKDKALATGLLCTNHGSIDTKETSNNAALNAMITACLSGMLS